jgi:protein-disulfide isomerase
VRRTALFAAVLSLLAVSHASADEETRNRLIRFFGGWYSWFPNTIISVKETSEVAIPGYESYRVQRYCDSKDHRESNVALVDHTRDEVFVGEVFHDLVRGMAKRPLDAPADLPLIQGSLAEAYGLPVGLKLEATARGGLKPLTISIQHKENAIVLVRGFVSDDGASVLIGEFHPLSSEAQAVRRRLLSESEGIRPTKGTFYVTEFLDFQCERCRVRAPQVKKTVTERGGAMEVRLLPLTKVHDWAFPAAEYGAALANVDPAIYAKYEEALFAREGMTAVAARQIASDIAEAAGAKERFESELSSGRARERVVRDIRLAIRLGLSGTPSFLHDGNFVSGEPELFEAYLKGKLSRAAPEPAAPTTKPTAGR